MSGVNGEKKNSYNGPFLNKLKMSTFQIIFKLVSINDYYSHSESLAGLARSSLC